MRAFLPLVLFLASCSNVPTPDGRMILVGGDHVYLRKPDGEVRYVGKNTKSFKTFVNGVSTIAGAVVAGQVAAAQETTSQVQSAQSGQTARAGIASGTSIELGKQSVEKAGIGAASEAPTFIPR